MQRLISRQKELEEYKYLGQWITADGRCLEEVKRRIGRAKSEFWELKELIRKDLNIKLKKRILETYIFSIVTMALRVGHMEKMSTDKLELLKTGAIGEF